MFNLFSISCRQRQGLVIHLRRSLAAAHHFHLENQMKLLNDRGQFLRTLSLFDQYKSEKHPTDRMIVQALKACTRLKHLEKGQFIHQLISPRSSENEFIQSTLINFYVQCDQISNAETIFHSLRTITAGVYASMMKGYLEKGMAEKAIELFLKIHRPTDICLTLFFNSCAQLATKEALNFGQKIVSQLSAGHFKNEIIMTSALNMFIKCDDLSNAEKIFSRMKGNVIDYGQMMKFYNNKEMPLKTLHLYEQMKTQARQPDLITFILVINACSQLGLLSKCQSIVNEIPPEVFNNTICQTSLIDMWGKAGSIQRAKEVFDKVKSPNIHAYTAMIHVYGLNGMGTEAVALFHRIPPQLIVDHTYVSVLNACSHSKLVNHARSIFSAIPNKEKRIYTAMVDCLSRSFLFDEAEALVQEFERDHPPYIVMYTSLLSGARNARNLSLAERTMKTMYHLFPHHQDDLTAASILLANTAASSGHLDKASAIRWKLSQCGSKKEPGLSWTQAHGELAEFRAHDRSHPRSSEIYTELDRIRHELIEHGHLFDPSWISRPMMPDETVESILNTHSERLALAFNFISSPVPSPIQITKNLRICGDCHEAIKLISNIRQCSILIRDARRIHHFAHGKCSCNDDY